MRFFKRHLRRQENIGPEVENTITRVIIGNYISVDIRNRVDNFIWSYGVIWVNFNVLEPMRNKVERSRNGNT